MKEPASVKKEKSVKHLYKIGEISKLYHIGTDSLRYYEEIGILKPMRGANGYRMYRISDLWRLNVIRDMRGLGFSMEQIKDYLMHRSIASTESFLQDELKAIDEKIASLQELKKNVKERIATLEETRKQEMGKVHFLTLPERNCYRINEGYKNDEEMDVLIKQLLNLAPHDLYIIGNNRIGSEISLEEVKKENYRGYTRVFIIDKDGDQTIKGGNYLSICYHGSCDQNRRYIPKLLTEAKKLGVKPADAVLELLWVDIHQAEDPGEHVTELQLRVE